ncbi:tetratricopeptide repeat protein [bacterium]|nr:tetratricopeptide repeat protein [bacterium]
MLDPLYTVKEQFRQDRWEDMSESAEKYVEIHPGSEAGFFYLGLARLNEEQYDDMNNAFDTCLKLGNTYDDQVWRYRTKLYIELRNAAFQILLDDDRQRFNEICKDVFIVGNSIPESFIQHKNSDFWYLNFWLGYTYAKDGLNITGIDTNAVRYLPVINLDDQYNLSQTTKDEWSTSLEYLDLALSYRPNHITSLKLKAFLNFHMQDYSDCIVVCQVILLLRNYHQDRDALLLKAMSSDLQGNQLEAIQTYSEYLDYYPNDGFAAQNLARIYLINREFELAINFLTVALKRDYNDLLIRYNLGECYYHLTNFHKAIKEFEFVRKNDHRFLSTLEYLAAAYYNLGMFADEKSVLKIIDEANSSIINE